DEFRRQLIDAMGEAATPELAAALSTARVEIAAPILERARVLRDGELVAVLLRRADEHRLAMALRRSGERPDGEGSMLIDRLLQHDHAAVAVGAMALLVAESRRNDRFGEPVLARTDLPAELQHRMVWWVAAALRDYLVERHMMDPLVADRPLVTVATAMLAAYDEGETLEGRAFELACRLRDAGELNDLLLVEAMNEGRLTLLAAVLALRAGIDAPSAWEMIADSGGCRLAVLLRAIDCPREMAGAIMLRLTIAENRSEVELADNLDAFDLLTVDQAREALRPWRLDDDYRRAIAALAAGDK
ncbi:MAG TPA: DUF2336 domain-containing protein, partial [Burkholderiaceae bacterium]|nr:DUF2336 domain-containing protein [Burkholderiaceae bacterium]